MYTITRQGTVFGNASETERTRIETTTVRYSMSACTFVLLTLPLHIRSIGHAEWLWLPSGARGDIWLKGGLYDIGLDNADPPPNN
jgi:hypothetical protein